jgi:hypothetical protein
VQSSALRTRIFREADAGDLQAADELLSEFKSTRSAQQVVPKNQSVEPDPEREKKLKGAGGETSSSTGTAKRRMYRQSDLINLRMRDPDKWRANQAEFQAAYAENRVIRDL